MQEQELSWQTADSLRIYARLWQPETACKGVVCLVHGLGEHSGRYIHVAQAFTQSGYALLAADLRGHGQSAGSRGDTPSYNALLDDISLLLGEARRRFPEVPCFLYGHSMGGNLVLNYVLRSKDNLLQARPSGVIASAPWLQLAFAPPRAKLYLARVLARTLPHLAISSGLNASHLCNDPTVVQAYIHDPLVHDRLSAGMGLALLDSGQWALQHARAWTLPLLLLHGQADRITSAQATQEFAESVNRSAPGRCTWQCWEGLCHELHNEYQQKAVFVSVISWLDTHSAMPGLEKD